MIVRGTKFCVVELYSSGVKKTPAPTLFSFGIAFVKYKKPWKLPQILPQNLKKPLKNDKKNLENLENAEKKSVDTLFLVTSHLPQSFGTKWNFFTAARAR